MLGQHRDNVPTLLIRDGISIYMTRKCCATTSLSLCSSCTVKKMPEAFDGDGNNGSNKKGKRMDACAIQAARYSLRF